jgi:prepilin-type processing-associated H-X9-DG protein
MPISFTCPHCGRQTSVADHYAGQTGPCVGCGGLITIPGAPAGASQEITAAQFPVTPPGRSSAPGWVIALLAVGAVGGLCLCGGGVFLLPAIQAGREASRRAVCAQNLKTIGLAMQQYQQQYGTFPPGYVADDNGRPKHSWRVLLLPYLDPGLASQYNYDEVWDGPNNSRLASQMPDVFRCPSENPGAAPAGNTTSYVVINSPGAIFEGVNARGLADIPDGVFNTLLVVEAADANIHWMAPRDLNLEQMNLMLDADDFSIASRHPNGANVLMADGTVHFLPSSTPAREIQGLVTRAGGESVVVP